MTKVISDISVSLDGFVAGPSPRLEEPLGDGGEQLHEWALSLAAWRERHGKSGGETNPDGAVLNEAVEAVGAHIMGRQMFGGGEGPWGEQPWEGWWGDEPPFRAPVFVLTHHEREPLVKQGGTTFTFVTDGIESALEQARAAAGGKDVAVAGGASAVQQYLNAGLIDEFQIHVAPVFLGGGVRLFEGIDPAIDFELARVVDSPAVTHLKYRVLR
jgi:dihydrofolate reductase